MAFYLLALAISILGFACAQESGWVSNQVNATMCRWDLPRVGVIRDTAYIDGGYLWWMPGMNDGSYGSVSQDGMPLGLIYQLNFSTPFNTSQNISQVLTTISKAPNSGAANNFAPQYYDGALFANDGELFTYGGLLTKSDAFQPPGAGSVLGYQQYWYGPDGKQFSPGFVDQTLPDGVTRYVTYGGAVNVPSENKGYYFGGMKASSSGPIFYPSANLSVNPTTFSNNLISVDMTNQQNEVWKNETVPSKIPGRASPELVWIPVGKEGILIAIGGVVDPVYAQPSSSLNATQLANSQTNSPAFISTVAIYDIASGAWYEQETTGGPSGTSWAQGCAVVASAADGSSHNIYYYGGFDGISLVKPFNDDVWILSVPSFMWMRVKPGTASHARAGHRCVKPYPDQMIVIGGYSSMGGTSITCVEGGIIQAFNLSSLEWMESYDPQEWSNYSVPSHIYNMIGGDASGGADMTAPTTWSNKSMAAIFSTPYDTAKITNWYPYALNNVTEVNTTRPSVPEPAPATGSGVPKWLAPVLGTVLGLVLVAVLLTAFLLFRRRRQLQSDPSIAATSEVNRYRVMSWIKRHDDAVKSPTITSSETLSAFGSDSYARHGSGAFLHSPVAPVEAASEMVHELADTSQIQELSAATGMAYLSTPGGGVGGGLHSSPSLASTTSMTGTTNASSPVMADSPTGGRGFVGPIVQRQEATVSRPRPDSPTEGPGGEALPSPRSVGGDAERRRASGLSLVSPATPAVDTGGFPKAAGSGEAGEQAPKGARRTSAFGEMLD